ncbi:MAG: response regulator [Bacteroidetes bacterium]|nr:response regulator [Bacteroidota bacterium]
MSEKPKIQVLYVDDERNNLVSFRANFRIDFDVFIAESADEGREILNHNKINVIITDQRMPIKSGVEFLEEIMKDFPDPVRILLTGYTDMETVIEAVNKGKIYQYVRKPYIAEKLKKLIFDAFQTYEASQKIKRDNEQYEFILRQKLLS